jgi:hypothetical protein
MRIAGHSSITMTMRHVHPQRDAIALAFAETQHPRVLAIHNGDDGGLVTKVVTVDVGGSAEVLQVVGAKGGTRTPRFYPPDPKSFFRLRTDVHARARFRKINWLRFHREHNSAPTRTELQNQQPPKQPPGFAGGGADSRATDS